METIQKKTGKVYLTGPVPQKDGKKKKQRKMPWSILKARLYFGIIGRIYPAWVNQAVYTTFISPRKHPIAERKRTILSMAEEFTIRKGRSVAKGYRWGAGPQKVLLVHGWESHAADFYNFIPALLKQNFSVVAMDAPGHGLSPGTTTNVVEYKDLLKELVCQNGVFQHIVTHSLGGMAVGLMLQEEKALIPEKMVYVSPPSDLKDVVRDYARLLWIPKASVNFLHEEIMKISRRKIEDFDLAYLSGTLDPGKVMIVHDVKDRVVPIRYAEKIHKVLPESLFLVTENFGHNKTIRDDLVIDKVLQFLLK